MSVRSEQNKGTRDGNVARVLKELETGASESMRDAITEILAAYQREVDNLDRLENSGSRRWNAVEQARVDMLVKVCATLARGLEVRWDGVV